METTPLETIITSDDPAVRDQALDSFCRAATTAELLDAARSLEAFRHDRTNLYERVRACFFLYAIYRFHLPTRPDLPLTGHIPFDGYTHLLERRFEEATQTFLRAQERDGASDSLASALAAAYHRIAFQTLANQVRRSVRSARGNQWMFRVGHPDDQPLRLRPELLARADGTGAFPVLREQTPVRMDLTHSGWSDIFFLGMDYPEGARVLNISVDLAVRPATADSETPGAGTNAATPRPPVEAYLRVIEEPVIRLSSVDLGVTADISTLAELFDFARDYLGLLKAALIASGIVPPGMEGSEQELSHLLARVAGPGRGLELVSSVNGIPKGSRLAVSTNLLAALTAACMRATGQTKSLEGPLEESERRVVASRAILGEWIAGSGGGWQDSGGVWPGIKLIEGQPAREGDPEWNVSRGRLLPGHTILGTEAVVGVDAPHHHFVPDAARRALQDSLVLVHGGMAQNVGPILEMVTEKYLLRSEPEWAARGEAQQVLNRILAHLQAGDIAALGTETTGNFFGPIQTIIPWASNLYTETLIREARARFGTDFWGFWMLGGMSGGGMGFVFAPGRKREAQDALQAIMSAAKRHLENALPFAMEPVVYEFAINERGTVGELLPGETAPLPATYYAQTVPALLRRDPRDLTAAQNAELAAVRAAASARDDLRGMAQTLFERLLPSGKRGGDKEADLATLLRDNGFDPVQQEQIRADLRHGRIGLAQNRLPVSSDIRDVLPGDVVDATNGLPDAALNIGRDAIRAGKVAVVTLAAGAGSRWTQGAGVVKALHPFARLGGKHRTFIETHLAKSRKVGADAGTTIPHVFTTSYLTHEPISRYLAFENDYQYPGTLALSPGQSIGLRTVPMARDLRFAWEEMPQQILDAQQQKARASGRAALLNWAVQSGEGSDYTQNTPSQCLHPVGHWFEVPNLLKNGTLLNLLSERPALEYLMIHNIDTLGANVDAALLGQHIEGGGDMTVEVIPRRLEDRGGGLARVDGRLRLVEGLAMPREEDEFALTYYNSLTTWIGINALLRVFGLTRETLSDPDAVREGIRAVAARMPTYITIKDVKRRWGHGQEDTFPVAQWERLWGDMTTLTDFDARFVAVPRRRGQQLKDQAQLDGWLRDGSAAYIETLCAWSG